MRVIATKTSLMPQSPPQPPKRRPRGVTRHKRRETARLVRSVLDAGLSVRGVEVDADHWCIARPDRRAHLCEGGG